MLKTFILLFAFFCIASIAAGQHFKPGASDNERHPASSEFNRSLNDLKGTQTIYKPATEKVYYPDPADNSIWVYSFYKTYSYNMAGKAFQIITKSAAEENQELVTSTYSPNPYGLETERTTQIWDNSNWENQSKYTWVYNSYNAVVEGRIFLWQNNAWLPSGGYQSEYSYYAEKILSETTKYFDIQIMNFVYSTKVIYTYDTNDHMTKMLNQVWTGNQWENESDQTYVWNSNLITEVLFRSYSNGILVDSSRYIDVQWHELQSVNGAFEGLFQSYTRQITDNGNWVNQSKYQWEYDQFDGYSETVQVYEPETNTWYYDGRYSEFYDSYHNYTGNRYELWDNGWELMSELKIVYLYDGNNNLVVKIWQQWDGDDEAFTNTAKAEFSNFVTLSEVYNNTTSYIKVFPIPAHDYICIETPETQLQSSELGYTLYDITGKSVIGKTILEAKENIDISSLGAGMYVIRVTDCNGTIFTTKFLKQ